MDANLDLKDSRVPTFIPFKQEKADKPVTKPATKRKRTAKNDTAAKPQKKKALKSVKKAKQVFKEESVQEENIKPKEPEARHVWIGAVTNEEKGAFSIYHGENDKRNYTEVYEKKDQLEDLEYAYVLGALKAVKSAKSDSTPLIVNTTCRDLPRAIDGKAKAFHYECMANEIRDLITDREEPLSVRHISGRHAADEQKAALALALEALKASEAEKQVIENLTVGELTHVVVEEVSGESEQVVKEKEDEAVVSSTSNDEQLNRIVEDAIDAAAQVNAETIQEAVESAIAPSTPAANKDVIVETQVETTVETTVEVNVIETQVELSTAEPMELVEEEEQEQAPEAPKSSWVTVLGLQSIINVLSSPFKARRN
ncbi:oxidation resistance protein 1 [Mucor velutinosus]|uniref:Oxidation resistance protein 1 n=1 Tax=Mucor velutinosus TaxID=708070 RepID=A0AAN7I4B2_9FUNG|nr:oxidation resistance protein 1 [Mucor velutinosus]